MNTSFPEIPDYASGDPRRITSVRSKRGFALLITITLLAFLVLLLVSLASLTRVETQVAANNQTLAQARQNALLALNIAIGQLQKYAGPDARVTARTEITSSTVVKTPYFTGVWDASGSASSAAMWLVGGSEQSGATAANLLTSAPDPSEDTVTEDTVFLVGNQSVVTDAVAGPTAEERTRRIKVNKQDIVAPAGSMPGLAATATPRVGRYAWWVGDQGVKASLALPDRLQEVTYAPWNTQLQRQRVRQQIASMPNYFRTSGASTSYTKEGFDPISIPSVLSNVTSAAQLGLVTPVAGSMSDFVRSHYHDFLPAAYGVLANTRSDTHAGLMRDLSLKPSELGSTFVAYASGDTSLSTSTVDSSVTAQALTTDQIEALATEIVRLIKLRGKPFRNLEEFLGSQSGAGTNSLLEAAIATTNLNSDAVKPLDSVPQLPSGEYGAGLSSLTLTQANILTALAPYLRTRSDTFTIRSYGEANNPVTSEVAGRAWLEAIVQRFPETADSSDNIDKPTGAFGRRFKIISFRWLSASDI